MRPWQVLGGWRRYAATARIGSGLMRGRSSLTYNCILPIDLGYEFYFRFDSKFI